jgi:hypothetical protein
MRSTLGVELAEDACGALGGVSSHLFGDGRPPSRCGAVGLAAARYVVHHDSVVWVVPQSGFQQLHRPDISGDDQQIGGRALQGMGCRGRDRGRVVPPRVLGPPLVARLRPTAGRVAFHLVIRTDDELGDSDRRAARHRGNVSARAISDDGHVRLVSLQPGEQACDPRRRCEACLVECDPTRQFAVEQHGRPRWPKALE